MKPTFIAGTIVCTILGIWAVGQSASRGTSSEPVRLIESMDGRTLYLSYCAVCHGTSGRGDGPLSESMKTRPTDLTTISARNGGEFPLARVEKVISGESEISKGHGTRSMPVWGPVFSQVERDQDFGHVRIRNLASYLKTIQTR